MRKILFLFALILTTFAGTGNMALAQSMTDSQVMAYALKEYNKGTDPKTIALNLIQKGATPEQLKRLAKKNGVLGNMDVPTAQSTSKAGKRSRTADAKTRKPDAKSKKSIKVQHNEIDDTELDGEFDATLEEEETEQKKDSVNIFGHDIFNNDNITFEPNMNVATPDDYVLGVSDMVYVDVYGASQQTFEGEISADGKMIIEGYGPVKLAGLTVKQATSHLKATVGARYESSEIEVSVGQTRTIQVNVMGEVKVPGTYTLSAFATAFHALYSAGGVTPIGTLRDIKIYRNGRQQTAIDVYDYILNGKLSGDIRMQDNDVIIVGPYSCLTTMAGFVKRPMKYEMKPTETVRQLLDYAGGFRSDAYTKNFRLFRNQNGEKTVFNIDHSNLSSFRIADGDSVAVDSMLNRYQNMVEIKGAVFRPGMYEVGSNIKTVKQLIEYADGLTEDAFTARAVMHRMRSDRTLEVVRLDIDGILSAKVADVPLQNEDVIFVPSLEDARLEQILTIHGEVRDPGIYQYAAGTTIEDLILLAGGLLDKASTSKVDVSRRISNQDATERNNQRAETFTLKIKDGFVVDGEPGFELMPYDEVYVRKSPGFDELVNVEIEGEVMFAGTYTLGSQQERLSSLIQKAGGITQFGHAHGAKLLRRITNEEYEMLEAMRQQADTAYAVDMKKMLVNGRYYYIGIDLEKALAHPGTDQDVVLEDGDRIIVPRYDNTITINGEVMKPNTVAYMKGKSAKYYINKAGGYGINAKKSRTYIIYQNGQVGVVSDGAKPEPGCEIIVPKRVQKTGVFNNPAIWISLGSTLATVGAVLVSALK